METFRVQPLTQTGNKGWFQMPFARWGIQSRKASPSLQASRYHRNQPYLIFTFYPSSPKGPAVILCLNLILGWYYLLNLCSHISWENCTSDFQKELEMGSLTFQILIFYVGELGGHTHQKRSICKKNQVEDRTTQQNQQACSVLSLSALVHWPSWLKQGLSITYLTIVCLYTLSLAWKAQRERCWCFF